MTLPPPPGSMRRRSVLQAAGVAAWRALVLASAGAALAATAGSALAAPDPEFTSFDVTRDEEGVFLSYAVNFELGKSVEDAFAKAVPLFFVAEADIFRDRWYWSDRRVARAQRIWKVVFQPLTSTYRVTTVGGLSQTYPTRNEALAAISRAARWRIAEPGQLDENSRHYLEFTYRLDITLLPRPMQIGIGGQPEWQLSTKRTQRIN